MRIINGDFLELDGKLGTYDCVFMDPPDNIGLGYNEYDDKMDNYDKWLENACFAACARAPVVWVSFNARWYHVVGEFVGQFKFLRPEWRYKPGVQVFTFGQHNKRWLSNCHRPLWCFFRHDAKFYPDRIKVESWRQKNGDKRAAPGGKVPGDVFDFPRVTGNSKQRRKWHPTQLHEGLVERCLKFSVPEGGKVLDPFLGTGTTMRVGQRLGVDVTGVDIDATYCQKVADEHELEVLDGAKL